MGVGASEKYWLGLTDLKSPAEASLMAFLSLLESKSFPVPGHCCTVSLKVKGKMCISRAFNPNTAWNALCYFSAAVPPPVSVCVCLAASAQPDVSLSHLQWVVRLAEPLCAGAKSDGCLAFLSQNLIF